MTRAPIGATLARMVERKQRLNVRLSVDEEEKLEAMAETRGISKSDMARLVIRQACAAENITTAKAITKSIRKQAASR